MRKLPLLAAALVFTSAACQKSSSSESVTSEMKPAEENVAAIAEAGDFKGSAGAPAQEKPSKSSVPSPATRKGDYRLLGILDPERQNMVAFALKMPSDWSAQQEFHRKWEGAVGLPQIGVTLNSPDGGSQIMYFPSTLYLYAEGPLTNNVRAQKRSLGIAVQASPNELAPMSPVAYLQTVFLPLLAQNGVSLRDVGNELTAPDVRNESGNMESRGSIDGTLPNGNRARVECRISQSSRQIGSDVYTTWSVIPSITRTAKKDLDAIHAHTRVAQSSIVTNPTWLKLEQEAQARGHQANADTSRRQHEKTMADIQATTEAMTRGHDGRMAAIRQFGEANTARFKERMGTMDRDQRIRVDTIRDESQYVNPTNGEHVKVADGYNHVYTSQQHPEFYLGSDTPIDAGALDWQELQKVQLKDY